MSASGRPYELCAGLIFKPCIAVMLELRSHRERNRIRESDLILRKSTEQTVGAPQRDECNGVSISEVVAGHAVVESPHDVVPRPDSQVMLKIHIDRTAVLAYSAANPVEGIVVNLQG